jgi:hypothetical protein
LGFAQFLDASGDARDDGRDQPIIKGHLPDSLEDAPAVASLLRFPLLPPGRGKDSAPLIRGHRSGVQFWGHPLTVSRCRPDSTMASCHMHPKDSAPGTPQTKPKGPKLKLGGLQRIGMRSMSSLR